MKRIKSINKTTTKRRIEIIETALSCFNELGYDNTGMNDISEKAGVSIGSIYHHFKSKEQLAAQVYLEGIRNYQEGYMQAIEKETDAKKGIYAIFKYHLTWIDANKKWSKYLFQMRRAGFMNPIEGEIALLNAGFMRSVSSWFRKQIDNGCIRRIPPDLYAPIIMGPCQEFTRMYLAGYIKTDLKIAIKELSNASWLSLKNG